MKPTAEHSANRFKTIITEAANRAEVTALLIRCGYRVYRPEADSHGEDLIVRTPSTELRAVQLKGRPVVNQKYLGKSNIWMLFPSQRYKSSSPRSWYFVPHGVLYKWMKKRHGHTWKRGWSCNMTRELSAFLEQWKLRET